MNNFQDKLTSFAKLFESDSIDRLKNQSLDCDANIKNALVVISKGKKYYWVDRNNGGSAAYAVDADGNIYGVKAWRKINLKKQYGTLDTVNGWFWGNYYGQKKLVAA